VRINQSNPDFKTTESAWSQRDYRVTFFIAQMYFSATFVSFHFPSGKETFGAF
jgi:hypothetical protein